MPIELTIEEAIFCTVMIGTVTDRELLSYYSQPVFAETTNVWRELVDGRQIVGMEISADGQRQLAAFVAAGAARIRGGRVAMVASDAVVYGMFRMWELQREGLGYEVSVFRDMDDARRWIARP